MLGAPDWQVFISERGGGNHLFEIPFSAFYLGRRINNVANSTVEFSGNCCDIIPHVLPAVHEIVAYREGEVVWAGPITDIQFSADDASISARDLSQWFDWRLILTDRAFSDDLANIFRTLVEDALALDPSPNIQLRTERVGIEGQRIYKARNFEVVGDKLRELTRTGLDYTMQGRTLIAGNLENILGEVRLSDPDVRTATATIDGLSYATEVYVLGAERPSNADENISPEVTRATGIAESGSDVYGRIQKSFVEADIQDNSSAEQNARSRLASVQPAPLSLNITLDAQCSLRYDQLIPGSRVDTRLSEVAGCAVPFQDMRMTSISTGIVAANQGVTEYTNLTLVPMGSEDLEGGNDPGE